MSLILARSFGGLFVARLGLIDMVAFDRLGLLEGDRPEAKPIDMDRQARDFHSD